MNTTSASGVHPHFTVSQWQELEHQALIFKYMMAGVPVPPDLLVPIRRSVESPPLLNLPSMGYYSFYGKKPDPEPGRCRRTDGKKWRCSKDAHPDSKYCERHMHRGRNRSRKPVESHTISHPPLSVNSLAPTSGSGTSPNNFQKIPFGSPMTDSQGSNTSQLQMDPTPYGMGNKDYRYLQGIKGEVDEHSFFSEASGIDRSIGMHSSLDSSGRLLPSRVCVQPSKQINDAVRQSNYSQVHDLQNLGSISVTSAVPKQQQHYFFGSEFGPSAPVKQEGQSLRPFFDEWPKSRNLWSNLEDERSNPISFSTTQLSMSIPMASSDFSAASSRSTNDEG